MDATNSETPAARYRRLAAAMTMTVEAVPDDRWQYPSPCEGWSARDVLTHVIDSESGLLAREGLGGQPGPAVSDGPAAAWAHTREAVQRVLDDPAAAGKEYEAFGSRTTVAATFATFMSIDLVVHRWDIARAAGLDATLAADDIPWIREFSERLGDVARTSGAFGPQVPVTEQADDQTRLLAFLGRAS